MELEPSPRECVNNCVFQASKLFTMFTLDLVIPFYMRYKHIWKFGENVKFLVFNPRYQMEYWTNTTDDLLSIFVIALYSFQSK